MPRTHAVSAKQALDRSVLSPDGVMQVPSGTSIVPGRVLVRFRAGVGLGARSDAVSDVDASVAIAYHLVPGLELLHLGAGSSVMRAVAALSRNPDVEYAVPDLAVRVAATPNDPLYPNQWGPPAIGAPAAWDRTTGSASVTVAVIDTGVDLTHPDLAANLVPGWNFVNNTNNPSDDYGHGTHVAGIIGAVGNNGTGVAGLNWNVKLMPLKVCDANGSCSLDEEVSALQYAVAHGVKLANASFGGFYGGYQPEEDAIKAAGQAGLLYVEAAGNSSFDDDIAGFYPASYHLTNTISVAATTSGGGLASFSNYGFNSVQTAAPGQSILSTMLTSGPLSDPSGYGYESGTSMATPMVTGAAALLWAEHPAWTMQQIRMRLLTTASPLASLSGEVSDCGQVNVAAATDPTVPDEGLVCVKLSGTGAGSVTSSPAGLNCGATCATSAPTGTMLTLSATPSAGSAFAGWSGACSGSGSCQVTASGVDDVTATFSASGSPSGWQQKRLPAPDGRDPFTPGSSWQPPIVSGPYETFYNVAVSADGSERAETVFNPPSAYACSYSDQTGGVFLEHHTAAGWVDDGALTAPSLPGYPNDPAAQWSKCAAFGTITKLSAAGTTLLVTPNMAPVYDPSGTGSRYRCAAYVYQRSNNGWALQTALYPPGVDARGAVTEQGCGFFGIDGAISADGTRIAMLFGGTDPSSGAPTLGVDIYTLSGGAWSLEQQVTLPNPNADCAGSIGDRYLSMSGDGATLLVGDPVCDDAGATLAGLVFAYARSGTNWTLTQTIHSPSPAHNELFGAESGLSQDGNTAVIGDEIPFGGTAWVFEHGQSGWQMSAQLPRSGTSPPGGSLLECSTVVEDGARIICGATNDDVGYNANQGVIYIYDRPAGGWASAQPQAQVAYATDGLEFDQLGISGPDLWLSLAAPENGSFIDAPMGAAQLALDGHPHDRIGYEFTTGAIDKTLSVGVPGGGSGSVSSDLAGISCGSICSHDYADGTSVTLTATPAAGYGFSGWTGDCSGTGQCALTMNADHTVSATFVVLPQLSVIKAGNGNGSVASSPAGISCGETCTYFYNSGTSVTLTATPLVGSVFAGWSGACSGTSNCIVSMTQARSVTASFNLIAESLTVSKSGGGASTVTSIPGGISCGSTCSHSFNYDTAVTLTAHPAAGYVLAGWSGACSGTSVTCHISMTAARTVTATFGVAKTLTVVKAGTGTGKITSTPAGISCTATCKHVFAAGTVVTLTAAPTAGSKFVGWSGACTGTGKCVVKMTAAKSVKATFKKPGAAPRRTRRLSYLRVHEAPRR